MLKRLAHFVLFGNYYLAFCIVALCAETAAKNGFFISDPFFYLFVFFSVVVYYTYAYINDSGSVTNANLRSRWYYHNRKLIGFTQSAYFIFLFVLAVILFLKYRRSLPLLSASDWVFLLIFPLLGLCYYGVILSRFRLRSIAWLKPFLIGFVCTGTVTIYPMLFIALEQHTVWHITLANGAYFLTNWLYTTVIAIMFDIKDFSADHNYHLKTFVVANGLRNTIFFILLPLSVTSFFSFLLFASVKHFAVQQVLINAIPFLLTLTIAASLRRRKGILYYLIVIDGLLLLKALSGILAMKVAT